MKTILKTILASICLFLFPLQETPAQPLIKGYCQTDISDLVLIYQGGVHRMDWNTEQFIPYIVYTNPNGNKQWLFDGFLFLEFKDGKGRSYAMGYEKKNARKKEWKWLIDRFFEDGKGVKALNEAIQQQKKILGEPGFKHKIVIGIPEPASNQKDWGELNGHALDFSVREDKIEACKWYIDEVQKMFDKSQLDHIQLAGYYWVSEDMVHSRAITNNIGDYIRSHQQKFYWIPYWNAMGYSEWKQLGFDVAYTQPNHFFDNFKSDERIDKSCQLAYTHGLGLELEFDERALESSTDAKRDRLLTYIDGFERNNVFEECAIAYYEGGGALGALSKSDAPADKEMINLLASQIQKRREKHITEKNAIFVGKALTNENIRRPSPNKLYYKSEKGWQYGRIDIKARIESPNTDITLRLLPITEKYGPWPDSGEITLLHHDKNLEGKICGGINTRLLNKKTGNKKETLLPIHALYKTEHIYSCVWTPNSIQLLVDGVLFFAMDDDFDKDTGYWPFNDSFYLEISATDTLHLPQLRIDQILLSDN